MPGTSVTVLILGGTGEARALARSLHEGGVEVISSLAGRVADPRLPVGQVRIGGFGGIGPMRDWLRGNGIRVVVDATHPFAATITAHAVTACAAADIPLLRLRRPAWAPGPEDGWQRVPTLAEAARILGDGAPRRVLLTTGRQDVGEFAGVESAWFLIRVVDPPNAALPPHHEILRSRGPYHLEAERELLRENRIDTLVTKDSGGELTRPKLDAARELGVQVIMVDRPAEPAGLRTVDAVTDAHTWVIQQLS
nr:cobalt-precorrin-6X reductase [Gordonia sp. NB41Y]